MLSPATQRKVPLTVISSEDEADGVKIAEESPHELLESSKRRR
jgi:hypothetical protein